MTCKGLLSSGDAGIDITTFNGGNAHLTIYVSGLEMRLSISPADLRTFGNKALSAAHAAEQADLEAAQVAA
jgi:hypothetical protein